MATPSYCPNCGLHLASLASAGISIAYCPGCGAQFPTAPAAPAPIAPQATDRELVPGGVTGWRAWDVHKLGKIVRLGSVTHQSHWPVGEYVIAECAGEHRCISSSDGRVPGESCTCGLYAAATFEQLTRQLPYALYHDSSDVKVIGEVAMAGKVIVGSQGYRAEKARVHKLYVPHTHWKIGRKLAETYKVEYELLRWIG